MESRAHPAPVAPPPMIITSYSSPLCNVFTCSVRGGSFRFTRGVAIAAAFTYCVRMENKKKTNEIVNVWNFKCKKYITKKRIYYQNLRRSYSVLSVEWIQSPSGEPQTSARTKCCHTNFAKPCRHCNRFSTCLKKNFLQ